jgi:hypothetical protein
MIADGMTIADATSVAVHRRATIDGTTIVAVPGSVA